MNTVYRVNLLLLGFHLAAVVGCGVVVFTELTEHDVSNEALAGVSIGYVVLAALVMVVVLRSSTTVTDEGIVVRRFGPARRHPWSEITDLRMERIHTWSRARWHGVKLYDAELRRISLPYVNDVRLGGVEKTRAVLRKLRQRVIDAAGSESAWRAREAKVDRLLDARLGRFGVWGLAIACAVGAAILAMLVVGGLLPHLVSDEVSTALSRKSPLLVGVPAALAFVVTVVVGLARQRRR